MKIHKRCFFVSFLFLLLTPCMVMADFWSGYNINFNWRVENTSANPLVDVKVSHWSGAAVEAKQEREKITNSDYPVVNLANISTNPNYMHNYSRNGAVAAGSAHLSGAWDATIADYWSVSFYVCDDDSSCQINQDGITMMVPNAEHFKSHKEYYRLDVGSAAYTDESIPLKRCDISSGDENRLVTIKIKGSKKDGFKVDILKPDGNCTDVPVEKVSL